MKVLFITPQLPWPLDQGARIRNYHLLRAVAAAHTVDLLSLKARRPPSSAALAGGERSLGPLSRAGDGDDGLPRLESGVRGEDGVPAPITELCRRVETFRPPARGVGARLRTLVGSALPDLAHRAWQPALAARVRALTAAERYDVVHISSLEMMPYRHAIGFPVARPDATRPRPLQTFDDLNAEYRLQRSACFADLGQPRRWHAAAYSAVQWRRLRQYEARLCREADAVVAVSAGDVAQLVRIAPEARYVVLPNGVDTRAFAPPAARGTQPPVLLFTGTMDYRPNVDAVLWFAETILPRLRAALPDLCCLVVGKAPDARLRTAAARQPGLRVTGAVPDVRPYLARAAVYVVPMRMGSGSRLKVLEALAAGVPIVSTRLGLEGIAGDPRGHALLAETPAAFADAVLRLLVDPGLGTRLAARGRALVEARHDWARLAPALPRLHEALLGDGP